jgi:hypothetical protein
MALTLQVQTSSAYVIADNRGLVLCNGQRGVLINRALGRWVHEALEEIAADGRTTRTQQNHAIGGFHTNLGAVVLFAGKHDDLVSVELSPASFDSLRAEFAEG